MSLAPGVVLNGYKVVALIGAGGMGEVYRAVDTRLNREVALKIVPAQMAADSAAYARFEREAQAVAALSHPNILAVHDVGRADGVTYAVFELLQGASLRERLEGGPLPVRKAIDYARQVADGLAAAHARGIAHRDIKPENLFVTGDGRVKILDFGLAQTAPTRDAADAVTGVTTQAPITAEGTILGTVGYMAPEQVRGQAVDHRADLFALGATLYEMCTGRRAFKGATSADTMSAVLSSEPPEFTLSGQPAPPALERIVRRCLEKQPAERFQSARDLSFALEALSSLSAPAAVVAPPPTRSRVWRGAVSAAVAAAALGLVVGRTGRPAAPATAAPRLRAELSVASGPIGRMLPSPDGRYLLAAERSVEGLRTELVLRSLDSGTSAVVPESLGALPGTWSPRNDEFLIISADGEVRRVRASDLRSTVVVKVDGPRRAIEWLADDTVVYAQGGGRSLQRMPIGGGPSTPVLEATSGSVPIFWVSRVGTRTDVVLALLSPGGADRQVVRVDLATGQLTPLFPTMFEPALVPGYVVVPRAAGLFAAPFDPERVALTGEFQLVGEPVAMDATNARASLGLSEAGVLAFRPGGSRSLQFEWLGQNGQSLERVGEPGAYSGFALSPDGSRIITRLTAALDAPQTASILRVIDLARGVISKVATPDGPISDPIWSADGTRILYRLGASVLRQSPLGTARETVLPVSAYPDAVSPDGRWIIVGQAADQGSFRLLVIAADGSGTPSPINEGATIADEGRFSPDGQFIAYQGTASGRTEVYLARFPLTDERWQVSSSGGVQPQWAPDGRALYYVSPAGRLMRVELPGGVPDRAGRPTELFDLGIGTPSSILEQYAVHGNRFLVLRPVDDEPAPRIVVINNWRPQTAAPATDAPRAGS